jgi:protein SCO1
MSSPECSTPLKTALALIACLLLAPCTVAGEAAARAGHGAGASSPQNESALQISQAAIGRRVSDYTLIDTEGKPRRLADYRGKPLVISLIYTSCYHICPTTTRHLAEVIERAQSVLGEDSFAVISLGFDAARDTPEAMRDFARQQKVAAVHWDFLSADAASIEGLARELGFQFRPAGGGFDHLLQTSILDADGVVRRQVYGMEYETPILIEPIKRLVFGEELTDSFFERMSDKFRLFCTVYDPAADRYRFNYSIIVGIAMGAAMGIFFLFLVIREWRHSARAGSPTDRDERRAK